MITRTNWDSYYVSFSISVVRNYESIIEWLSGRSDTPNRCHSWKITKTLGLASGSHRLASSAASVGNL